MCGVFAGGSLLLRLSPNCNQAIPAISPRLTRIESVDAPLAISGEHFCRAADAVYVGALRYRERSCRLRRSWSPDCSQQ